MAGKSYKQEKRTEKVFNAIDFFYSDLVDLAEEVREVVDNASEGLSQTSRMQTLGDTADTLESISAPDEPPTKLAEVVALEAVTSISVPRSRRVQTSRAVRCENACGWGRAAIDEIRGWCDQQEDELQTSAQEATDNIEDLSEGALQLTMDMRGEREELIQTLRDYCDEVEGHIDEAEGVEFPGMYG